jgi:hypothetical protein
VQPIVPSKALGIALPATWHICVALALIAQAWAIRLHHVGGDALSLHH